MHWHKVDGRYFLVEIQGSTNQFLVQTLPFMVFALPSPVDEGDLKQWIQAHRQNQEPSFENFFALDVLVTARCNFRCTYCYALSPGVEGFYGLKPKDMSTETAVRVVNLGVRRLEQEINRSGSTEARLDLFITGGEPTLNFVAVRMLLEEMRKQLELVASRNSACIEQSFEMATNASLVTEEIAQVLKDLDVQVTVTIDGSKHNERRPFSNGGSSLDQVLRGLECLIKFGNRIKLQAVVPLGDSSYLDDIFAFYKRYGLLDRVERVHVIPQAASILDRYCRRVKEASTVDKGVYEQYAARLRTLSITHNLDIKQYQGRLFRAIEVGGLAHRCPVAQWKLAVTPEGDLYPCHQLVNVPEFYMGNVCFEDVELEPLTRKASDIFGARTVFLVEPCRDCILQTICIPFVDCPARCFLETRDLYVVPEHYCHIHRPYMEELLESFILGVAS